jgi:hypothetical protein
MLSLHLVQRHLDAGDYTRLVRALACNGLAIPLPLQARLSFPAAAVGLALRRVVELTWGPTPLTRHAQSLLLHLQRPDGTFAGSCDRDPLATAAAAAAFRAVMRNHGGDAAARAAHPHARALAALASMQADDGLFSARDDRTWQDRAATAALILHLLADDPAFVASVRHAELLNALADQAHRLDDATAELYRLALASRPQRGAALAA